MELIVLYVCNEAFIQYAGISMLSLFDNNKDLLSITVYFFDNDISEQSKLNIVHIADKYKRKIVFVMPPDIKKEIGTTLVAGRWGSYIFQRLLLEKVLPASIKRILYLDSDTIITASLSELIKLDMSEYIVAGVRNSSEWRLKQKYQMPNDILFLNAGFLLFNLAKYRAENIEQHLINTMIKISSIEPSDEAIVAEAFYKKILLLHPRYNLETYVFKHKMGHAYGFHNYVRFHRLKNFYTYEDFKNAIKNPALIHYSSPIAHPWKEKCCHPLKNIFLTYKSVSPWKDTPLKPCDTNLINRCTFIILFRFPPFIIQPLQIGTSLLMKKIRTLMNLKYRFK